MRQPLTAQVANQILQLIADDRLAEGDRLPERPLAERLRVSRSPVREALKLLAAEGAVVPTGPGGYAVGPRTNVAFTMPTAPSDEDGIYFRIAEDRLSGDLPNRISENELMRRYGISRGQLSRLLRRISNEGWLERLPGHGWAFAEMLTAGEVLTKSYRFRIAFEPSALLEPTYVVDRPALERCREQQRVLLDLGRDGSSPAEQFDANANFHVTLIEGCGNPFFVDALKRISALRRLVAYRRIVNRPPGESQFGEHIEIINRVLEGNFPAASALMRAHLEGSMRRP
jgi:DNA-binding GntR family transcriptional regulator